MEIWLCNGLSDKIQIPINPEQIGYDDTRNFDDIVMASGNEKSVIGGRNLKTYSFSSFFSKYPTAYQVVANPLSPMDYVNKLKKWMDNKTVLQLQVTTTNINDQVTIRSFKWTESGGTVGDIDYDIEFKEYSNITYSIFSYSAAVSSSARPPAASSSSGGSSGSGTYTVVRGDCLWNIAKKYYGSGSKWPTIYNANKSVIGGNPNLIFPGQKLVIP